MIEFHAAERVLDPDFPLRTGTSESSGSRPSLYRGAALEKEKVQAMLIKHSGLILMIV